jgi:adenylate kinase family enzyme
MERIHVVGSPGSGKTTTAAAIATRLGVPHLELDSVHWLPGWQERDAEDFRRLVLDFAAAPSWVIDGNYNGRLQNCLDDLVDTYVWLDVPRWRAVSAVTARSIERAVRHEELWNTGNREQLSSLVKRDPLENLVMWSWTHHAGYRQRYGEARDHDPERWIQLRSRRDVDRFLASIGNP